MLFHLYCHLQRFSVYVLLILTGTLTSVAQTVIDESVRVGWFESSFNHLGRDGRRSGYAYEYQQRISANTGWTYEYVEGSWATLFGMLQRGEIDLLSNVSFTEERAKEMLFSEVEMGTEDYYILSRSDNSDISAGEFKTLDGKRVGVNRSSLQQQLLTQWKKQYDVALKIVELEVEEEAYLDLLQSGEIDAIASNTAFLNIAKDKCLPVARIGTSKYYFAISKYRPELKRELDKAMSQIRTHNVYYNADLHEKYFAHSTVSRYLPASEAQWLQKHGTIRIGYRDNYLPFCAKDPETGEAKGLLKDFIERVNGIFRNVDLQVETIAYPTINEAMDAVHSGDIDVAFPNGMGVYDSEIANLLTTDPFVNSAEMAVVRSDDYFHAEGKVRAAINANNPNYVSLIDVSYPEWELVHFPSTYECLKGVSENKADLLLVSNYRISVLDNDIEKFGLKAVATGSIIPLSFAVNAGNNHLFSIMSRLSQIMSETEIHASLAKYSEVKRETTVSDFIKDNSLLFIVFMSVITALILFLYLQSLKEHRKAKEASKAKSMFLFNMSHDIRTPMNAIIGYSELMKNNIDDKEKCKDYLAKLSTSGNFLLGLINNVLEMARIENGKIELNEEPLLIKDMLSELKGIYQELMEEKGISFKYETDIHTPAIYCDIVKINQIYLNLISNAYKYTPAGGSVAVNIQELPCDREGYMTLHSTITDTGNGMSKDFLPHLFEEFSREKNATESKISGTGLGMPIVKRMVELMGGTITVESELGKGTTFTVEIAHKIADEKALKSEQTEEIDYKQFEGKRLLLAEDNELNAEIAIEILSSAGFVTDHAEDGAICVDMLKNAPAGTYEVILMDIQMPNLNGYDATRQIRALEDPAKANIPVIAMTANAFAKDQKDAKEAGMNGHLAKPIDVPLLMKTLATFIKK